MNLESTSLIHFIYNIHRICYRVPHKEINITNDKYQVKASIKIPSNANSNIGIVLAHGGIVNRQSLLRSTYSFGEYLSNELGAYVISPDFLGETIHKKGISYENFSEIITLTTEYLVDNFQIDQVMGFGHSLGCFYLVNSLNKNIKLHSIVNYGGPIREFDGVKRKSLISYLINYLSTYNYSINIRNMLPAIFDKETCIYLEEVMLKNQDYCAYNYEFRFDSTMVKFVKETAESYLDNIIKWGKPALLLFGSDDGVTRKTINYYKNNPTNNQIQIEEIKGATHVTPCMNSLTQLKKLDKVISFFKKHKKSRDSSVLLKIGN